MKNQELFAKHSVYNVMIDTMKSYMDAYLADVAFKRSTRPKRPSEDQKLYNDMIGNTFVAPTARFVVDRITDTIFETGQSRTLDFIDPNTKARVITPDWAQLFLMDTDYQNADISGFMQQVSTTASIFGHCYIFVDKPTDSPDARPYSTIVPPTDVWDWQYQYSGGRPYLAYIKVVEQEDSNSATVVEYTCGVDGKPTTWMRWLADKSMPAQERPATLIEEGTIPNGMRIPAFIVRGRRDPRRFDIGVSDIDTATDAMREHYVLECEIYQAAIFSKTLLRVNPSVKSVPVHAGGIVRGQAGDIEAVSIDTGDIAALGYKQDKIISSLTDLTGLSGMTTTKSGPESGVSIIEGRRTLHTVARTKARHLEAAEQMMFTYAARFMGLTYAGDVKYNTNYSNMDTTYRIALMKEASALAPDDQEIKTMVSAELKVMLRQQEPEPVVGDDTLILTPAKATIAPAGQQSSINTFNGNVRDVGPTYDTATAVVMAINNQT